MRDTKASLFILALAAALFLHGMMARVPVSLLSITVPGALDDKKPGKEITVERYVAPDPEKPVVQTSRAKDQADDKDAEVKYSGELKNRVEKETQSPVKGAFREGGPAVTGPEAPVEGEGDEGKATADGLRMADLLAFGASPNSLPNGIGSGNETVLNTDPVRFASFINRIAGEVYDPWVKFAREAVSLLYDKGTTLESNVYITKLSILINPSGGISAIQTLKSCGVEALDEAPKRAFWHTEPFPNPPVQMFEKEEYVRFVYEFHFEWKTSSFNIVPFRI